MLSFLRIRNLAIVKDLSLQWGKGLNLLTGETGAGKSILVDALGLALGDRASSEVVRSGAQKAEIEAVFSLDEDAGEARALLAAAGLECGEDQVVARREIGDGSRSRQFLCETSVSLATLRRFGDLMVEIQGQHEHHALLGADAQREALDRFAGIEAEKRSAADLARAGNEASETLATLDARLRDRQSLLDYLRFQIQELETLSPAANDEEGLRAERVRLQHASRRRELAECAYRAIYEEEPSLLGGLAGALASLRDLGRIDPEIEGTAAKVEQAMRALEDAALEIRDYRRGAEPDPQRLEQVEERLAAYEKLARKHAVPGAELARKLDDLRSEAARLDAAGERLDAARAERVRLRAAYLAAARELSSKRRAAASRLASTLSKELATLAMDPCEVKVEVRADEPGDADLLREQGLDQVEILLSPNPGEPLRPLAAIVSGGELSRVMLAVNGALGRKRRRRTLIFDEVDAGIGGRVAAVVGEKLRALAASHQVIVVTHLPQIASLADQHHVVEKRVEDGRTIALVRELDHKGRVAELARMLGGEEASPAARRHAAELLRKSAGPAGGPERRSVRPERRLP